MASNTDVDNGNLQEENMPGNYWTIVSNERGELRTTIETSLNSRREPVQIGQNVVPIYTESEQSIIFDDVKLNDELDGYLNPIHSCSGESDEYIHPFIPIMLMEGVHPFCSIKFHEYRFCIRMSITGVLKYSYGQRAHKANQ
ncbi:hypothetical protein CHS0354_033809 [Potamilus streckersoni]|uniref:Uncharacterized protein n=1 Tax=Potamilus streckersoni TaxID=2493646 RepID=A0AAE0VVT0_9BIVA|nr:hypothetical protein CHS0354_033809 [Potamilus streckersoni]